MPESVSSCCPSARHAGRFDCLMSTEQPHSDNNEQWQGALCMVAVLQGSQPNPQRNWKLKKCMPRLDLSGTPGLRPIGLSPGSWQTSLGLGSMSRYSAQILICITNTLVKLTAQVTSKYIHRHCEPGDSASAGVQFTWITWDTRGRQTRSYVIGSRVMCWYSEIRSITEPILPKLYDAI